MPSSLYSVILYPVMEEEVKRTPFEKRIHEIDLIRGILMCLVVLDHIFNLLRSFNQGWAGADQIQPFWSIYQVADFYWTNPVRMVVRWICLGGFCFVSGISCAFSKNNWKRAGQMIALWAIIFVGSNILEAIRSTNNLSWGVKTMRVDFNIIGVLAWSTLIYCFVQDKNWKWLMIIGIIGLCLHPLCYALSWTDWCKEAYVPFLWKPENPAYLQADYMPLFPYLGFFFGGALLSKFTYSKEKKSYFKRYNWERPICFVGRHSLVIYVSHFLLLIGIFSLVGLFIK